MLNVPVNQGLTRRHVNAEVRAWRAISNGNVKVNMFMLNQSIWSLQTHKLQILNCKRNFLKNIMFQSIPKNILVMGDIYHYVHFFLFFPNVFKCRFLHRRQTASVCGENVINEMQ